MIKGHVLYGQARRPETIRSGMGGLAWRLYVLAGCLEFATAMSWQCELGPVQGEQTALLYGVRHELERATADIVEVHTRRVGTRGTEKSAFVNIVQAAVNQARRLDGKLLP